ncbi:MAG: hypothetical protein IJ691_05960 [Lachnospiraceae bacterium]|nr:hypothetical protein [Lachnospiraceae bacterium]
MKKSISLMLVSVLALSLAACSSKENAPAESTAEEAVVAERASSEVVEEAEAENAEAIEAENAENAESEESKETENAEASEEVAEGASEENAEEAIPDTRTVVEIDVCAMEVLQDTDIYDTPDDSGNVLENAKAGWDLIIFGYCEETGWYETEYANNKIGFINGEFLGDPKPIPDGPTE